MRRLPLCARGPARYPRRHLGKRQDRHTIVRSADGSLCFRRDREIDCPATNPEELSPYQLAKKIEKVIDETIRPILHNDGGDIEIIDIKGDLLLVSLRGACADCESATQTLRFLVEDTLKTLVSEKIRVVQV